MRDFFFNFCQKCFRPPEKLRIATFASLRGARLFSSEIFQNHMFDKKKIVSINSELTSEITTFLPHNCIFWQFQKKIIQNTRLAMNSPMWLILKLEIIF